MSQPLLELKDLGLRFGGLSALSGVSLTVGPYELLGLIGPNGAGKTSLFNLVTGVYQASSGEILFLGNTLKGLAPQIIARRGVARTFQNIRLFGGLSVIDNVRAALLEPPPSGLLATLLRSPAWKQREREIEAAALALLEEMNLGHRRDQEARSLPYGEQRRLEIARALALQPRLLLLDEPAAGLNPVEKEALVNLIRELPARHHLSVLLVEHSMRVVMQSCKRIAVLDYGQLIATGSPSEIQNHPKVLEAYLGEGASHY